VIANTIADVQFGQELPGFVPDTSLAASTAFAATILRGAGSGRFSDHEAARREGLPGALLPGVMSQGFLVAMIHRWAPGAEIRRIDTVFRAPVLADQPHRITGVVTDIDSENATVEVDLTVTNEKGETRVFGTATVQIPRA
jgi:hypothetical protein